MVKCRLSGQRKPRWLGKASHANVQVLWVDLLTKKEFEAGFGSHTPMYSGQTKCVRYYMNFDRAMAICKRVLLEVRASPSAVPLITPSSTLHPRLTCIMSWLACFCHTHFPPLDRQGASTWAAAACQAR